MYILQVPEIVDALTITATGQGTALAQVGQYLSNTILNTQYRS